MNQLQTSSHIHPVLGDYYSGKTGKNVIVIAGLHGNEYSPVNAVLEVFRKLNDLKPEINGRVISLAGNIPALREGVRYIEEDLNRIWDDPDLLNGNWHNGTIERQEQKRLLDTIISILDIDRDAVIIDLHTSSSPSIPFIPAGDNRLAEPYFRAVKVPVVRDPRRYLKGMLIQFFQDNGFTSFAYEGGEHSTKNAQDDIEAAIWLTMAEAGLFNENFDNFIFKQKEKLHRFSDEYPAVLEIIHRHAVQPDDEFKMNKGFKNFDRIEQGDELASDRHGFILSPYQGYLLMPLYQNQGEDGFFIAREID
ncbi:succinylglutamate desuccinylase/aspartoacylase family protein [bacterium]|nr:succinylglutamate desuccinylase/aspartoacylase family protein [bacterium]